MISFNMLYSIYSNITFKEKNATSEKNREKLQYLLLLKTVFFLHHNVQLKIQEI